MINPPPAPSPLLQGGGWMRLLVASVDRWHPAAGRSPVVPPPGCEAMATRLASRKPEEQALLLGLLRQRLRELPFELIHASWLVPLVPDDPLLRRWCLATIPPTTRRAVLALLPAGAPVPTVFADAYDAPEWFGDWWRSTLWAALPYPLAVPGSRRDEEPISVLWSLGEEDLLAVLRSWGLRFVAAAVRQLPRDELVAYVYTLPAELQSTLVELAREAAPGVATAWVEPFTALRGEARDPHHLAMRLALLDLTINARAAGRDEDLIRVAYRLPRALGEPLLAPSASSGELVRRPQDWHAELRRLLDELLAAGAIRPPAAREESLS